MSHVEFAFNAFDAWADRPLGGKVLDVGARDSVCRERLEARGFEWDAVDCLPSNHDMKVGFMESLSKDDFPSNHYDLVFVCHSFEHCERPVDALREFMRVLKPGGSLFIATPYPDYHNILGSDEDHIFCLGKMHFERLLIYTCWDAPFCWVDKTKWGPGYFFKTVVSTARKPLGDYNENRYPHLQ